MAVLGSVQMSWAGQPFPVGGEISVNDTVTSDQDTPRMALRADGSFAVVYESLGQDGSFEGLYLRNFGADGTPQGAAVAVNTTQLDDQADPDLAVRADGSLLTVWDSAGNQDGEARGIFGRLFTAAGAPASAELPINLVTAGDQNDSVVAALPGGGFFAVWETMALPPTLNAEDLVGRFFDALGAPVGGEIAINTTLPGDQEDASVGADGAGNIVVVWESDGQDGDLDSIVGRVFDPAGVPLTGEFLVNAFSTGAQENPSVSAHPEGHFVVAWEDEAQDLTGEAVIARFFDLDGLPLTDEFQVDAFETGNQGDPHTAFDAAGHAVVVWTSGGAQDGASAGVFMNRFSRQGRALGLEEAVNSTTDGPQFQGNVAANRAGDIVVTWTDGSGEDGDADGVFAQRYSIHLFSDGFEGGDFAAWDAVVSGL